MRGRRGAPTTAGRTYALRGRGATGAGLRSWNGAFGCSEERGGRRDVRLLGIGSWGSVNERLGGVNMR